MASQPHLRRPMSEPQWYAAKTQSEDGWWEDTHGDDGKLQRAVCAYHERCPVVEGKRAAKFRVLHHIEDSTLHLCICQCLQSCTGS
jgi:hypothetical protein